MIRGKCNTKYKAITQGFEEETYLRKFSLQSLRNQYVRDIDKLDMPQEAGKAQQINYNMADMICQCSNKKVTM